jgi:putative secretion ATPase (PEP-CTERM system associated)
MFEEFYGLSGKPFQLTPDAAFFYPSSTHRKALSYLGYGLAQGEGFIVITGEVGSGKSTLVAHLVSTVDPERMTVGQVVTSSLDGDEIVHVVARSFGLDIDGHDKASALGSIEAFLHDEARAGRRCLLVVDESQNLSVSALEELRMLSNFQLGNHPLLQTLLLGQPEFRGTLQSSPDLEQLRQRVIAQHHLEAIEAKEVEPYVVHRLRQVGWTGDPALEPALFAELYAATGGIPRRINQVFTRLLLLGAVEEQHSLGSEMLANVLNEIASDNASDVTVEIEIEAVVEEPQVFEPAADEARAAEQVFEPAPAPAPGIDPEMLDELLAERDNRVAELLSERDGQIAELQQAVVELATAQDEKVAQAMAPEIAALQERLGTLEAQMLEQERTIRHTLTMLIEWVEGEMERPQAA